VPENAPPRVVIAEDDFLVSEEIIRAVRSLGFDVVGDVATGRQAVELVGATKPDLVIMDIQMPGMSGIEAAREIQESEPTPVIILTAHETQDLVQEASEAGVAAYLTKPPDAAQIERAAHIAMARFRDMMEIHRLNEALIASNWKLREALERIQTLEGILPLCSSCRRIPHGDGEWLPLESYISRHTKAEFSHGFCPTCEARLLAEIDAMPVGGSQPPPQR
jgi:YesN/AraC family two-component response regulator